MQKQTQAGVRQGWFAGEIVPKYPSAKVRHLSIDGADIDGMTELESASRDSWAEHA